jgi:hypothetical protein
MRPSFMAQQTPQRTSRPNWSAGLPEPEILESIRKGLLEPRSARTLARTEEEDKR